MSQQQRRQFFQDRAKQHAMRCTKEYGHYDAQYSWDKFKGWCSTKGAIYGDMKPTDQDGTVYMDAWNQAYDANKVAGWDALSGTRKSYDVDLTKYQ